MSQAKIAERAIFPYMVTLQAIPILAIVPLIGFWFGYGTKSRVFVCVIISIFPIIVNTLFGLQSADRGMHDLFTLHHANRDTRLRKLMFPAALPAIFAGLRISAGLSVIGAVVGDFFFGQGESGIGQLLKRYAVQLDGEELLAAVIMTSLLGVVVFWTFGLIQQPRDRQVVRVDGRQVTALPITTDEHIHSHQPPITTTTTSSWRTHDTITFDPDLRRGLRPRVGRRRLRRRRRRCGRRRHDQRSGDDRSAPPATEAPAATDGTAGDRSPGCDRGARRRPRRPPRRPHPRAAAAPSISRPTVPTRS